MDDILDDLVRAARSCTRAASELDAPDVVASTKAVFAAVEEVGAAWSGSSLGYHANVYLCGLRPRMAGEAFDSGWGLQDAYSNRSHGPWVEWDPDDVRQELLRRAGDPDLDSLNDIARRASVAFDEARVEILACIDAISSADNDKVLVEIRTSIFKLKSRISREDWFRSKLPKQMISHDHLALQQGPRSAPHVALDCWIWEQLSAGGQCKELAKLANRAVSYLQKKMKMKGRTISEVKGKIFIGHGRSQMWLQLRDFLVHRLKLDYDEFNRESAAGIPTQQRLEDMLDAACFAFFVLTAEDEHADGSRHARENVIHEVGLFQGRYGFHRAIVLLEEGCEEFSNIRGLGQIRFAKGQLSSKTEEIRQVLERERLL